jgi:hypothetical protein
VGNFQKLNVQIVLAWCVMLITTSQAFAAEPNGLYLMTRYIMGSSLEIGGWYFKNGSVSKRPVGNITQFDIKAAAAKDPNNNGTYSISGNKMTILWANGQKTTSDLEPDKTCFMWDMGSFCPAEQFPKGTRLEGVFDGGASAGYGRVANATTLTLSKDGHYKLEQAGSVHSEVSQGTQLYGGSSGGESGTYDISGTTLTLNGGKSRTVLTFPYDDGTAGPSPRRMMFDSILLKRIK